MIVATINHQKFAVETLKDAETLFEICARAIPVREDSFPDYEPYLHPDGLATVRIEIMHAKLMTLDEHRAIQADVEAKRVARRESLSVVEAA